METNSLTSKVLNRLGSIFLGRPESLGMGPDFYFDVGDRIQPTQAEIGKCEVVGRKIGTNVFRLNQTYSVGPKVSAVFALLIFGGTCLLGTIKASGDAWKSHEAKAQASALTDATSALGTADLAHCSAALSDINDLAASSKKVADMSPAEVALNGFMSTCLNNSAIAVDPIVKGQPFHYHARKYDAAAFAVANAKSCGTYLADFNAMTAQSDWRLSTDADAMALRNFALGCQNQGFIQSNSSDAMAEHPVFSVRKYNPVDYMFPTSAKCNAVLPDVNALFANAGWRNPAAGDNQTISSFANTCVNYGYLKVAVQNPDGTESLSTTGKP